MPKSTFFPNISRKFTKGVSFSCPRCHRSNAGHPGNRFAKKLGRCYIGLVERPLDCSVAEYGQLALWTGIVGEAPGHAQCPLRGLGMVRHSRGGNGRRVGRVVDYTDYLPWPAEARARNRLSGMLNRWRDGRGRGRARGTWSEGEGPGEGGGRTLCSQRGVRDSISAGIQSSGRMLVRKKILD